MFPESTPPAGTLEESFSPKQRETHHAKHQQPKITHKRGQQIPKCRSFFRSSPSAIGPPAGGIRSHCFLCYFFPRSTHWWYLYGQKLKRADPLRYSPFSIGLSIIMPGVWNRPLSRGQNHLSSPSVSRIDQSPFGTEKLPHALCNSKLSLRLSTAQLCSPRQLNSTPTDFYSTTNQ